MTRLKWMSIIIRVLTSQKIHRSTFDSMTWLCKQNWGKKPSCTKESNEYRGNIAYHVTSDFLLYTTSVSHNIYEMYIHLAMIRQYHTRKGDKKGWKKQLHYNNRSINNISNRSSVRQVASRTLHLSYNSTTIRLCPVFLIQIHRSFMLTWSNMWTYCFRLWPSCEIKKELETKTMEFKVDDNMWTQHLWQLILSQVNWNVGDDYYTRLGKMNL